MKKEKTFKKVVLKLHEILGLGTGIIVFIVSITGCLWAFKDEIQGFYSDYKTVEVQDASFITATEVKEVAQSVFPDKHIHGALFGKEDEAIEVIFYEPDPEFYQSVFLNPYSGEVLHVENHEEGFFHFILEGHMVLWLPEAIGSRVINYSVLLFLLMLISGIVLWWPKNKKGRKQRLTFDWKKSTRWKRKNFDLHAVTGFYICILAFVIAFTGSVMAYDWLTKAYYTTLGGDKLTHFVIPKNVSESSDLSKAEVLPIDKLIPRLQKERPDADSYEIHYPYTDSSSIYVEVYNKDGVYYSSDYRFFDQYTLEEIRTPSVYGQYAEASFADKLLRMNYDIHVGAIGGLPGKIIAFLVSLITATLPVTGFLMWLGRRNKKKKKNKKQRKSNISSFPANLRQPTKRKSPNNKEKKVSV